MRPKRLRKWTILEKMENDTSVRTTKCSRAAAINAKVNDSDPDVEEEATILRQLKKPDSVAYKL
jgi:hypothetical protein